MAIKRIKPKINGTELGEFIVNTKAKTVVQPCPKCKKHDKVLEILYGYISDPKLGEKYYIGGCVIDLDNYFEYHCDRCDLDF